MESSCQFAQQSEQKSLKNPKKIPLLEAKDKQFHLTQKAKDVLESLKGECYVISVSGSPMIGKSSLLNFLYSFFSKDASEEIPYQKVYQTGNGKVPTTDGVDMCCLSKKGKNFIFLDVEGDNDPIRNKTGVWMFTNFLQTALGISHVHIYNYTKFPQKTFLNYFQSMTKVLERNDIHPEFKTRYTFLMRDDPISSKEDLSEDIAEYKTEYKRLGCDELQYSLHLLPMPPRHIIKNESEQSCIASTRLTRLLCKDCQSHLFISMLLDFANDLNQHLSEMTPFESGNHLGSVLEQLLKINRKELPYFLDQGHVSQMRLDNLREEQKKIITELLGVEQHYQAQNGSNMGIQKFLSAHPDIKDKFNQVQMSLLEMKFSKMELILPRLSQFIEECLLEENALILNENEKKILWDTHVSHFKNYSGEITNSLKEYKEMAQFAREILGNMKKQPNGDLQNFSSMKKQTYGDLQDFLSMNKQTNGNLQEFVSQSFELFRRVTSLVIEITRFSTIESPKGVGVFLKTFSVGIFGTIFAAYLVYQNYQKLTEMRKRNQISLNSEKGNEIYDMNQIEENLRMMEGLTPQAIADLEKSLKILENVSSEEKHENEELIKNIEKAMEEKVKGKKLSPEMRARIEAGIVAAEKNLQNLRECLCNSSVSAKNDSEKRSY